MSFKVCRAEWDSITEADQAYIRQWRRENYPKMDPHVDDITLPIGKEFRIFCDGRGFLLLKEEGGRVVPA